MGFVKCFNVAACFLIVITTSSGHPLLAHDNSFNDPPGHQVNGHRSQLIAQLIDVLRNTTETFDMLHVPGAPSQNTTRFGAQTTKSPEERSKEGEARREPWDEPRRGTTEHRPITVADTVMAEVAPAPKGRSSHTVSVVDDLLREYCYRLFLSGATNIPTYCYQVRRRVTRQ